MPLLEQINADDLIVYRGTVDSTNTPTIVNVTELIFFITP